MCLVKKTRPLDLFGIGFNEESLTLLPTDVEEDYLSELETLVNATEITRAPFSSISAIAETISKNNHILEDDLD